MRPLVFEGLGCRPLSISRDEVVCGLFDRRCDDEGARQPYGLVRCSQTRRGRRDLDVERDDREREPADEVPDRLKRRLAAASRADHALGER